MNTNYAMSTYRDHTLNIAMKTSSGDVITLDFANKSTTDMQYKKSDSQESLQMHFSSMQSFQFSIETNGIDVQDKKEIAAFMKKAQPYIDNFLKEFDSDAKNTPVTKIAHKIIESLNSELSDTVREKPNLIKTNIVKMFDNSLQPYQKDHKTLQVASLDDIFKAAQKILEKTLKEFDKLQNNAKELYA